MVCYEQSRPQPRQDRGDPKVDNAAIQEPVAGHIDQYGRVNSSTVRSAEAGGSHLDAALSFDGQIV